MAYKSSSLGELGTEGEIRMARVAVETSSFGWLAPPANLSDGTRRGFDQRHSDNWPIPLVSRRAANAGWHEMSGDWFNSNPTESLSLPPRLSADVPPYRVVSRTRLRLAHALFAVAFLALVSLAAWEVDVYYGGGHIAHAFASFKTWLAGIRL
jgi:hypothetical protein